MDTKFEDSARANEAGDFECNICFDLAQDPIVTRCGHLYCWPCLYRWLSHHSQSHECPVCKALVVEDKLVPLYGRGKSTADPRTRPVPGIEIPSRPSGNRPETAPPPAPESNYFSNFGLGSLGGFMPAATATVGNVTMSAGFGGFGFLLPGFFNFQINHGFPEAAMYGFPYGHSHSFYGGGGRNVAGQRTQVGQGQDSLKLMFMLVGFFVLLALFWN